MILYCQAVFYLPSVSYIVIRVDPFDIIGLEEEVFSWSYVKLFAEPLFEEVLDLRAKSIKHLGIIYAQEILDIGFLLSLFSHQVGDVK